MVVGGWGETAAGVASSAELRAVMCARCWGQPPTCACLLGSTRTRGLTALSLPLAVPQLPGQHHHLAAQADRQAGAAAQGQEGAAGGGAAQGVEEVEPGLAQCLYVWCRWQQVDGI